MRRQIGGAGGVGVSDGLVLEVGHALGGGLLALEDALGGALADVVFVVRVAIAALPGHARRGALADSVQPCGCQPGERTSVN